MLISVSSGTILNRLEAALSKKIKAPLGAVEAEAMAYEAGLLFAKDIGIQDFIVEGDSLVIHRPYAKHLLRLPLLLQQYKGYRTYVGNSVGLSFLMLGDRVINLPTY